MVHQPDHLEWFDEHFSAWHRRNHELLGCAFGTRSKVVPVVHSQPIISEESWRALQQTVFAFSSASCAPKVYRLQCSMKTRFSHANVSLATNFLASDHICRGSIIFGFAV